MSTDRETEASCVFDLAICCVFQNEGPYLREWIEFHKMMGVQQFMLVNDRSTDGFGSVLKPYIDGGDVTLFSQPCPTHLQGREWIQYQLAVSRFLLDRLRGVSRWVAFIDTDEFIVPTETVNLVRFLSDYESYGGVYIRWEPFGTSYVKKLSRSELLTEKLHLKWKFKECYEMLGKSIVKPHRVLQPNIHQCELLPPYHYFDSNPGMKCEHPNIRINHYWARDEHFLINVKLPRNERIKGWEVNEEKLEFYKNLFNDVPDHSMARFILELRKRVFAIPSS